jgi:hypothetical protein
MSVLHLGLNWRWHDYCRTTTSALTSTNRDDENPVELRALAAWYRGYAEQAGSTVIWDYRLSTAEGLERQASALEVAGQHASVDADCAFPDFGCPAGIPRFLGRVHHGLVFGEVIAIGVPFEKHRPSG